jgi:anti-anti-sigma factor
MELRVEPVGETITRAKPVGRWDVAGAMEIELQLSALCGSGRSLIVDMAEVSFLSSMGIRAIVSTAKALAARGAKLVLMSPTQQIAAVLVATGIDTLVPICHDLGIACAIIGVSPGAVGSEA